MSIIKRYATEDYVESKIDKINEAIENKTSEVEELFYMQVEEPVFEINAKLLRRSNHMFVLVYMPAEYEGSFYVYIYARDLQAIEVTSGQETQITDGVRLEKGSAENYINRFLCKLDFNGGLLSAYWGTAPKEYQSREWSFLNQTIKCTHSDGIDQIVLRNLVGDKVFPKGTVIRIVGE